MRNRRGFTLVEILISLVILSVVMGAIYQLLNTTQRLSRAQAEQVSLQSNVRTGSLVVPSELRELNTVVGGTVAQNDILAKQPDNITYRAMRGFGQLCESPASQTQLRILRSSYSGYRDPVAGRDSVYVFLEGNPVVSSDDGWMPLQITGVATGNVCPGAAAGITLTTAASAALPGLAVRTPVRTYEVMQLSLYNDADGRSWLGARSVSAGEATQPLLGPLTGNGFLLEYFGSTGAATTVPSAVKSIRITVRGQTDELVRAGGTGYMGRPEEALVSQVLLRNSIRP
jgi:prepilin-type N-terminal cleavage/methylation domain-containing protein